MNRQALLCWLKADSNSAYLPAIHDPTFGLFMEQLTLPNDDIETMVERFFGVESCGSIKTEDLDALKKVFNIWRKNATG